MIHIMNHTTNNNGAKQKRCFTGSSSEMTWPVEPDWAPRSNPNCIKGSTKQTKPDLSITKTGTNSSWKPNHHWTRPNQALNHLELDLASVLVHSLSQPRLARGQVYSPLTKNQEITFYYQKILNHENRPYNYK